jgi:hypothetical protein
MSHNGAPLNFGPTIDTRNLPDLYAPQEVKEFSLPRGGIDNLSLSATDSFRLADGREFEVDFEGYFRVARAEPKGEDWATSGVEVNMVDMRLSGKSDVLGPMRVRLNPEITSAGQTFPRGGNSESQACRIAVAALFEAPEMGITLYNTEPVLLMNDAIDSIPPVEDPNGHAHIYRLPLYPHGPSMKTEDVAQDQPLAYVTSLRYTVGNYITEEEAESFRAG